MLRKFALDPMVIHDPAAFAVFVAGLGVDQGRLLAEFPSKWRAIAFQQLKAMDPASTSPIQRKRAEALLERLAIEGNLRAKSGVPYEPTATWKENAARNIGAFAAAIYSDDDLEEADQPGLYPASSLISGAEYWEAATLARFRSTGPEYLRVLRALLELHASVAIMDPYAWPEKRYLDLIRTLSESIPSLRHICIHCSGKVQKGRSHRSQGLWQTDWETYVAPYLRQDLKLHVCRWGELDYDKPHERWLVTPLGGVSLDRGVAVDGQMNTAHLLPTREAARLWNMYGPESYRQATHFPLLDSFELTGTAG